MKTTLTVVEFHGPSGRKKYDGPAGPLAARPVITSVRVEHSPSHDHVHIWNRGGKAGDITVEKGDGIRIARRLFAPGDRIREEQVDDDDTREYEITPEKPGVSV